MGKKNWYMYFILFVLFLFITNGCSSPNLNEQYDIISNKIEALQKEQKAIVNTQTALENLIKAKKNYEIELEKLFKIREENEKKSLPVGPDIEENENLEEMLEILNKNYNIISDTIRKLEKERNEIVKKQMKVEN